MGGVALLWKEKEKKKQLTILLWKKTDFTPEIVNNDTQQKKQKKSRFGLIQTIQQQGCSIVTHHDQQHPRSIACTDEKETEREQKQQHKQTMINESMIIHGWRRYCSSGNGQRRIMYVLEDPPPTKQLLWKQQQDPGCSHRERTYHKLFRHAPAPVVAVAVVAEKLQSSVFQEAATKEEDFPSQTPEN